MESEIAWNSRAQVISIVFFKKKEVFSFLIGQPPLFTKYQVYQCRPRSKPQSLLLLLAVLLMTAGSILASVEVQICKVIEQIILENGWQKFTFMHAGALSRYCWFGNTASVHLTAIWTADFCSTLLEAVKQGGGAQLQSYALP